MPRHGLEYSTLSRYHATTMRNHKPSAPDHSGKTLRKSAIGCEQAIGNDLARAAKELLQLVHYNESEGRFRLEQSLSTGSVWHNLRGAIRAWELIQIDSEENPIKG
jgi:hypothetical protein